MDNGKEISAPEDRKNLNNPSTPENKQLSKRVTVWDTISGSKLSGTAAPTRQKLEEYLSKNPSMERLQNQDEDVARAENWRMYNPSCDRVRLTNGRLYMIDSKTKKAIGGNRIPRFRNMEDWIAIRPDIQVKTKRCEDPKDKNEDQSSTEKNTAIPDLSDEFPNTQASQSNFGDMDCGNLLDVPLRLVDEFPSPSNSPKHLSNEPRNDP